MEIRFRSPEPNKRFKTCMSDLCTHGAVVVRIRIWLKTNGRFHLNSHQIYNSLNPNWCNRSYLGNFQKSTPVYPKIHYFSKSSVVISFWGPPFNNKPKHVSDSLFGALGTIQKLDATILSCTTCKSISISFTATTV